MVEGVGRRRRRVSSFMSAVRRRSEANEVQLCIMCIFFFLGRGGDDGVDCEAVVLARVSRLMGEI